MRDTPFSSCEGEFIGKCIAQRKRLDGRECYDYRRTKISFGVDRGCCQVELGNTRVMCQVSSEVGEPKSTRPADGILFVNVELSPMAAPHFEAGRQSEAGVELSRILERCIKESRCVDTESLCIMAGVKVWCVRCDIHVLNHEGNIIDCASIAAISALAHFRRPDVTVAGEEVTIHPLEDRDPIPLSIHHMPICCTIGFFEQGKFLLVDPAEKEEKVMDGKMVIGMNKHREICTFQLTGSMTLTREQILRCSNIAVVKVTEITELIHNALENDTKARLAGERFGFAVSVEPKKVTAMKLEPEPVDTEDVKDIAEKIIKRDPDDSDDSDDSSDADDMDTVMTSGAGIGEGGESTWKAINDEEADEDMVEELIAETDAIKKEKTPTKKRATPEVVDIADSDSEEEDVVMLGQEGGDMEATRAKSEPATIDLTKAVKKPQQSTKKK